MLINFEDRRSSYNSSNNIPQWLNAGYPPVYNKKPSQRTLSEFYSSLSTTGNYFSAPQESAGDESPNFSKGEQKKPLFNRWGSVANQEALKKNQSSSEMTINTSLLGFSWDKQPISSEIEARSVILTGNRNLQIIDIGNRHSCEPSIGRKQYRRNSEFSKEIISSEDPPVNDNKVKKLKEQKIKNALKIEKAKKPEDPLQILKNKKHDNNLILLELKEVKEKIDIIELDKLSSNLRSQIDHKDKIYRGHDMSDNLETNLREIENIIEKLVETRSCMHDCSLLKENVKEEMNKIDAEMSLVRTEYQKEKSKREALLIEWQDKSQKIQKKVKEVVSSLQKTKIKECKTVVVELEQSRKGIAKIESDCKMLENMINIGLFENVYFFEKSDAYLESELKDYIPLKQHIINLAYKIMKPETFQEGKDRYTNEENVIAREKWKAAKEDIARIKGTVREEINNLQTVLQNLNIRSRAIEAERDQLIEKEIKATTFQRKESELIFNSMLGCLEEINCLKQRKMDIGTSQKRPILLQKRRTIELVDNIRIREKILLSEIEKLRERKQQNVLDFEAKYGLLKEKFEQIIEENRSFKQFNERESKRNLELNKNIKLTLGTSFSDFLEEKRVELNLRKKNYENLTRTTRDLDEQKKTIGLELNELKEFLVTKENELKAADASINHLNNEVNQKLIKNQNLEKEYLQTKEENYILKTRIEEKMNVKALFESHREEHLLKIIDFAEADRSNVEKIRKLEQLLSTGH